MRTSSLQVALAVAALAIPSAAQLMNKTVDVDGVTRQYLMYLPSGYDGVTELPVLFTFHGGDMTSLAMLNLVDQRPLADAHDFILVYPQGLPDDGANIWNSVGPFSNGVDEIGFVSTMIDDLDAQFAVDTARVYACGYSNGANLVWELGCFLGDRIAAGGAVAGSMWEWTEDLCTPSRPFPVMSIHGTQDFYNPWGGGPPYSLGLVAASEYWVQNANGDLTPDIVNLPNTAPGDGSTVTRFTWSGGDECVDVAHYRVNNGGHDWPGVFGNMDIDSNQLIWDFVSQYDLNGRIGCVECSIELLGVGAGGANIASLDMPVDPQIGGSLQLDYAGFNGATTGFLLLGAAPLQIMGLGGTFFLDPTLALLIPVGTAGDGTGSLGFPLPVDTSLIGLTLLSQAVLSDGSQIAGWAFSNGVAFTLCE